MRFTASYSNGIESVDRNSVIQIVILKPEGELTDDDDVLFLRQGLDANDFDIICGCAGAVARSIYELIALSIQDEKSVTQRQLYAALRSMSKTCTGLWERGIMDKRIDDNM